MNNYPQLVTSAINNLYAMHERLIAIADKARLANHQETANEYYQRANAIDNAIAIIRNEV